jgi:hypothetical protein
VTRVTRVTRVPSKDLGKTHRVTRKAATPAPTSQTTTIPVITNSINLVIEAIRVEIVVEEATAIVEAVVVVVKATIVEGILADQPMPLQQTAAIGPTTSRTHALITATKTVAISPEDTTPTTTNAEMTVKTRHTTPITLNPTLTETHSLHTCNNTGREETITAITNALIATQRMIFRETVTPMTDQ